MRFQTTVLLAGKTATGLPVPEEVVASLGGGKRVAVTVTINGYAYRTTVAPYNGAYMLPLSAENRSGAGVAAGEQVTVDIEVDSAPREVTVPADLAAALAADPVASAFFEGLSYTNKRQLTEAIEAAKKPATRTARLEKTLAQLREGRTR